MAKQQSPKKTGADQSVPKPEPVIIQDEPIQTNSEGEDGEGDTGGGGGIEVPKKPPPPEP